jgi:pyruvate dehydrogenase E1 component
MMMASALDAQQVLADQYDVAADVWSATSYKQLRDDALSVERWNRLHPTDPPQRPHVALALNDVDGPIVAVTDFVKTVPDQIARWVPQPFIPLGTDGFGLSDTRTALRQHFEVDARHIVVATLHGLAQQGQLSNDVVAAAIHRYGIDTDAPDPRDA